MLYLDIPDISDFDENIGLIEIKARTICLEHSLVSISKWESKWHKAFLSKDPRTAEETNDYIRCMTLTKNVDPIIFNYLTPDLIKKVNDYIDDPMTATWFSETESKKAGPKSRETVTSELIYYWMIALQIPMECQRWHLNRLLTLVKVCNIKNTPPEKISRKELMNRNRALNKARRSSLHSKG